MKFGKLNDLTDIDFTFPEDPIENQKLFDNISQKNAKSQIFIGTTGWYNKEWQGTYYPKKTSTSSFLVEYSKQLDSIELNTTHYRIPTIENIESWKQKVSNDFKFCPKITQSISHRGPLKDKINLLKTFYTPIQELGKNLGICFMQLPESYGSDKKGDLKHFLNHAPSHIPLAVEFRDKSWFSNRNEFLELYQILESYKITPVISDVAGRRDVLHLRLSTDKLIVRFVGNSLHSTDYFRLDQWIQRLSDWFNLGLKEVYFFFHQPDMNDVPPIVNYFVDQVNKTTSLPKLKKMSSKSSENSQLELF